MGSNPIRTAILVEVAERLKAPGCNPGVPWDIACSNHALYTIYAGSTLLEAYQARALGITGGTPVPAPIAR